MTEKRQMQNRIGAVLALVCSVFLAISSPRASADDSVYSTYVKSLKADIGWAMAVKESFSPEKITSACATYSPQDYPACYLKFVNQGLSGRKLTTTGSILLEAVGVQVIEESKKSADTKATSAQKPANQLKAGLDLSELILTLLEKDQDYRKNWKFVPPGSDADLMALVAHSIDDKYQVTSLTKMETILEHMASSPCLVQGTCPELAGREKSIEDLFWRVKEAAPKTYHELTDAELKQAAARTGAHLSREDAAVLFGNLPKQ